MPIPRDYCRYKGKKCMELRVNFPNATCKKTGRCSGGSESLICIIQDAKEDILKPYWCTKK